MHLLLGSGGLSTEERRVLWRDQATKFLSSVEEVLFVPFAIADHDSYLKRMLELNLSPGKKLIGMHQVSDPKQAVLSAKAIFVGGGNTFRLLETMYRLELLDLIRERVKKGDLLYLGISAGSNLACPTVKTTNDMPITYPPSLNALGLIPFQLNPHYFGGAIHYETSAGLLKYGGETRDDRIREFHEMNEVPVVGLWEGTILERHHNTLTLHGEPGARLFLKGKAPENRESKDLSDLL